MCRLISYHTVASALCTANIRDRPKNALGVTETTSTPLQLETLFFTILLEASIGRDSGALKGLGEGFPRFSLPNSVPREESSLYSAVAGVALLLG